MIELGMPGVEHSDSTSRYSPVVAVSIIMFQTSIKVLNSNISTAEVTQR